MIISPLVLVSTEYLFPYHVIKSLVLSVYNGLLNVFPDFTVYSTMPNLISPTLYVYIVATGDGNTSSQFVFPYVISSLGVAVNPTVALTLTVGDIVTDGVDEMLIDGVMLGVILGVLLRVGTGVFVGVALTVMDGVADGVASMLTDGVALGDVLGEEEGLIKIVVLGVILMLGVILGVMLGVAEGVAPINDLVIE